ncbi:MAG: biopolymer transporter ExbD [Labilithrix sp.]|nr:biopolymer transporter ExbD [Labilithrix sp.]
MARAMRRASPSRAPASGRRALAVRLSMTSMIDVLVVMTVFLLLTFTASGECGCRRDLSGLPAAANGLDIVDAPIVDVRAGAIAVDGVLVVGAGELDAAQGRVARIDALFNRLAAKRAVYKQIANGREAPPNVILSIDGDVPASLVKSVVMTAARSGYASIDFMVHAAPKG